jgi:hypothetical protein
MLTVQNTPWWHFRMEHPPWVLRFANQAFVLLEQVSRHKTVMCLLVMAMTMTIRIALLPRIPIPQPYVVDEYSYLLGAETFASGRLTNPMHPMWVHFETFHELMRPTYMSMYPPGQALFLAMGWKLLGHPWFGVWISFGLFGACLCWMLQSWVPPVYALLGTAITLAKISLLGYWMNSYWGGAVAAIAGCLVLGALPRLARRVKSKDVVVAAIGLVLLANTRPYEGLVMSAAAILALLFWRTRRQRGLGELLSLRCVIPLLLVCGAGALLDGYYNYRVTGNALLMPWTAYSRDYRIAPPWIIMPERQPPVYRHVDIEKPWEFELEHFRKIRSNPLLNVTELYQVFGFYCSSLFLFPVTLGILLSGSYRLWTAAAIFLCVWCGLLIESAKTPHYIAPSVGLLPLFAVYGFRLLRVIGRSYGPVLLLALASLLCLQRGVQRGQERGLSWETGRQSPRMIAMREAMKSGGRHLILVRYSDDKPGRSNDCVYNSADIDASEVVWARDMGETKNRELVNYYQGSRKIWLYHPDIDPATLIPYESMSQ